MATTCYLGKREGNKTRNTREYVYMRTPGLTVFPGSLLPPEMNAQKAGLGTTVSRVKGQSAFETGSWLGEWESGVEGGG